MGQFSSALSAVPFALSGVVSIKPLPSRRDVMDKILPTALFSAVTMFTGNYAYLYLSVAFIQILKALTPAMTLLLLILMGIERWSGLTFLSVIMIAIGTGVSALIESATPSFHLIGFLSFMISSATEAGRVVWFQVAMGELHFNVFDTMLYLAPVTGCLLGLMALLTEREGMMAPGGGFAKMWATPGLYAAALGMSCLVNLTTFIAIRQSSSLTFKVHPPVSPHPSHSSSVPLLYLKRGWLGCGWRGGAGRGMREERCDCDGGGVVHGGGGQCVAGSGLLHLSRRILHLLGHQDGRAAEGAVDGEKRVAADAAYAQRRGFGGVVTASVSR
jgi:uncharacterized membrane protein YgcG